MTVDTVRDVEHTAVVRAPVARLYALVADVTRWPVVFGPCIHATQLERTDDTERIEIRAQAGGQVKTWISRRVLDQHSARIEFRQERSAAPIAAMSGTWAFHPLPDGMTKVVLTHSFSAVDDDRAALDWIDGAVDANSVQELAALGRLAAQGHPVDDLVFAFSDRLEVPGGTVADAYDFVYRSDLWPQRLPHVARVRLHEPSEGVQNMEMDTVTADRRAHTTTSVRLCFPDRRIVYKQTVLPTLLAGHSGVWEFTERGTGGVVISSQHTVAIDPAEVQTVLGAGKTLADARDYVRDALGANSRTTMAAAGAHAADAVRRS